MSYPGLGLPTPMYTNFTYQLQYITSEPWTCEPYNSGNCFANTSCHNFFNGASGNLSDYRFRIGLTNNEKIFMPLSALMRDYETPDGNNTCEILVYNLDPTLPGNDKIVLGVPIF